MRSVVRRLKLAFHEGDFLRPDTGRWIELGKLSVRERIELLLGAAVSDNYTVYGSLAAAAAETVIRWNRGFSHESLRQLIIMIALKNRIESGLNVDFPESLIKLFV